MSIVRQSIGIWIILILFSLPFPLDWLPSFGEIFSELIFPIIKMMDGSITTHTFASDSKIYYLQSALLLIPSIGLGWVFHKKLGNVSREVTHIIISYALAFFLFKYGIIKLFQHQFYTVEPNIAYTPVGSLSKDILFWTSMGTSYSYNLFMGLVEILAGALLLSKRTRMLGSLMATGVFIHVFAVNIGFNITVKLLSFTLLIASVYLMMNYGKILINTFILHLSNQVQPIFSVKNTYMKRAVKGLVVSLYVFECLYPFLNEQPALNQKLSGSYSVIKTANEKQLFSEAKRIHFHSGGYLICEDDEQQFVDYPIRQFQGSILLEGKQLKIYKSEKSDTLKLNWTINGERENLTLKKINNKELPIYQDDFNWTLESMID